MVKHCSKLIILIVRVKYIEHIHKLVIFDLEINYAYEIEAIIQRQLEIWPPEIPIEQATVPCQIMEVNMAENLTDGCH